MNIFYIIEELLQKSFLLTEKKIESLPCRKTGARRRLKRAKMVHKNIADPQSGRSKQGSVQFLLPESGSGYAVSHTGQRVFWDCKKFFSAQKKQFEQRQRRIGAEQRKKMTQDVAVPPIIDLELEDNFTSEITASHALRAADACLTFEYSLPDGTGGEEKSLRMVRIGFADLENVRLVDGLCQRMLILPHPAWKTNESPPRPRTRKMQHQRFSLVKRRRRTHQPCFSGK